MSIFDRYEFLVPEHGRRDLGLLRWALVIVFLWFGAMKFTAYEAYGIAPFIEHSPIMNWLGMFGTQGLHIPADHEHQFRFNVNTISGPM
ncbi:DUF417 family protein [Aeromonas sanarellii]